MLKIQTFLLALLFPFAIQAQVQFHHILQYQLVVPNTTLAAESGNNTAAADSFAGCEVTTVTDGDCVDNGNVKASNVSKVDIHTLLSPSQQGAKVYTTYIPYWGNRSHPDIGYSSQDPHQVSKEIADLTSRGFNGVLVDWYGPGSWEDGATQILKPQLEQQSALTFALMIDQGAIKWHSCYSSCSATQALLNLISYARSQGYFSSHMAMKSTDGKTIVTQFGLEAYSINWNTIRSANTDLEWIFRNAGAFTSPYTIGAFGWLSPKNPLQQGYEGLDYTQYFLRIADQHPSMKNWASSWKGFDDSVASWSPPGGRHIQQFCGKTWLDSWATIRSFDGRLDAVQAVTWHDYEEGTEIQSGIDNCITISASVSGHILTWQVADESTLDHYTAYISTDGQNLMSIGDYSVGTHSLDLAAFDFPPGNYAVFVKAVGKPSIVNHMSAAAAYNIGTLGSPTVSITSPYDGQHAGPYTNLNANASSPNGSITQYQIYVDGSLVRTLSGSPSFQAWIGTPMGIHTITVKAEDSAQQWGSDDVWINRTY